MRPTGANDGMSAPAEPTSDASVPLKWDAQVRAQLQEEEHVVASFESDLDSRLRYAPHLVVLTSNRLLAASASGAASGNGQAEHWRSWSLGDEVELKTSEQGVVGTLELVGVAGRLAHWRYSAA